MTEKSLQPKVGVCGLGVVGSTVLKSFNKRLSNNFYSPICFSFDLYKNINKFSNMLEAEILFLCLPTEISSETKTYNLEPILSTLSELEKNNFKGLLVLKSTLVPGTCKKLCETFPNLCLLYNPEFLSVKTSLEDFENQKQIIIGGVNEISKQILKNFFIQFGYGTDKNITLCSFEEAECTKIFCNSFYACKVQIFTEFYKICERLQVPFETVREMMLKNEWIHPMHTSVPGPDGNISFGGMCLPKDSQALLTLMKDLESPHKVLEKVLEERNEMREC